MPMGRFNFVSPRTVVMKPTALHLSSHAVIVFQLKKEKVPWVLWKGSLATEGGTAAAMAMVVSVCNSYHPNYVCCLFALQKEL